MVRVKKGMSSNPLSVPDLTKAGFIKIGLILKFPSFRKKESAKLVYARTKLYRIGLSCADTSILRMYKMFWSGARFFKSKRQLSIVL
jgi:hypothetical protein